ncbi:hypothetical protein [Streptomyces minutiscleroticus]|uniref:Uncharacterized protein n=1 Tax=Streptomyces minutiscleroticus TaxID=68238 RepID=A0A918KM29_9ACTN|nr:hypothetical protein [Streptomyces minutiscleroticus]GGX67671.1 hypothetical protein GCM10010358_22580 [Streptomyces minutiscleroticus]
MFGRGKQTETESDVLVLREADVIAASVRRALAEAGPEERPGLERAVALVAEAAGASDAELRARWTRDRLAAAGVEGPYDSVPAVKALREAVPGLSLLQAVRLTKEAEAHRTG